jgi:ParB/RepB/Spo0J family partition protein
MEPNTVRAEGPTVVRSRPEFVELSTLDPNPFQPRLRPIEDDPELDAMVADIRRNGFRGTIEVRKNPDDPIMGRPQIVAGHRRAWAAKKAGLTRILVQWVSFTDEQMEDSALTENLIRQDLTPWEEAIALQRQREKGRTYEEIATLMGKSKGWIQNRLRLLTLEGPLREAAIAHPEMLTVLNTLLALDEADREPLFARVQEGELNVEDLRSLVRAQRRGLKRLESSIMPDGGRRIDVSLEAQRMRAATAAVAEPIVGAEREPAQRDAVWENLKARAGEAPYVPPSLPVAVENPHDNPEGMATGLTVDNGIDSAEDLIADLAANPTDPAIARDIAANITVGPNGIVAPTRQMVDDADSHWRSSVVGKSSEEVQDEYNLEFYRTLGGVVTHMRRNVERTTPARMTAEMRKAIRQYKRDINDLLVIF